jgi:hypothetical protein
LAPFTEGQYLSKYKIVKGDLLIAMSGATTDKIGIYKTDKELLLRIFVILTTGVPSFLYVLLLNANPF